METTKIYRENVPVRIDDMDFGLTCTLVRYKDADYKGVPYYWGMVAFTKEQAERVMNLVNSTCPGSSEYDYLTGSIEYDEENDRFIEYSEDDFTQIYDMAYGFVSDGVKLYSLGSDWCWTLEEAM